MKARVLWCGVIAYFLAAAFPAIASAVLLYGADNPGSGNARVRVYDGVTGSEIRSFAVGSALMGLDVAVPEPASSLILMTGALLIAASYILSGVKQK